MALYSVGKPIFWCIIDWCLMKRQNYATLAELVIAERVKKDCKVSFSEFSNECEYRKMSLYFYFNLKIGIWAHTIKTLQMDARLHTSHTK